MSWPWRGHEVWCLGLDVGLEGSCLGLGVVLRFGVLVLAVWSLVLAVDVLAMALVSRFAPWSHHCGLAYQSNSQPHR